MLNCKDADNDDSDDDEDDGFDDDDDDVKCSYEYIYMKDGNVLFNKPANILFMAIWCRTNSSGREREETCCRYFEGSFACIIPHTGWYIPWFLLHQL